MADAHVDREWVEALRAHGHDVTWVVQEDPRASDREILARAQEEGRLVITFDKDFGELAFRLGLPAAAGIVLFRERASDAPLTAGAAVGVLESREDWAGHFSVVEEGQIRVTSLPAAEGEVG